MAGREWAQKKERGREREMLYGRRGGGDRLGAEDGAGKRTGDGAKFCQLTQSRKAARSQVGL